VRTTALDESSVRTCSCPVLFFGSFSLAPGSTHAVSASSLRAPAGKSSSSSSRGGTAAAAARRRVMGVCKQARQQAVWQRQQARCGNDYAGTKHISWKQQLWGTPRDGSHPSDRAVARLVECDLEPRTDYLRGRQQQRRRRQQQQQQQWRSGEGVSERQRTKRDRESAQHVR
jgi:hypothetical protein